VATDRESLLRNAEQLLQRGKLEQAIAEYRRLLDDQPRDWNTANVLGDLYLRARQIDKAVDLFVRIADHLGREGFWSKAGALYKKILKVCPTDEVVLLRAAEMAAAQDLLVDARAYLNTIREQRWSRGDKAGVAEITIRLAALEPTDYDARLAGARAQITVGDAPTAVSGFKKIAGELIDLGRLDEALAALAEAAQLAPADLEITNSLARISGKPLPVDSPKPEPASVAAPVAVDDVEETPLPGPTSEPAPPPPRDLDSVFADLRDEASRRFATNNPEQELAAGIAFYRAGQLDFAVPRLEAASRMPAHRFESAATLGRIFLERGDTWQAIDWFERAAEASAPTPADTHRLLYELADALEGVGEIARALAICLELQAEAGDYQDVSTRVDRLVKVQARG
jgi:tetratricopeptide (TPR) repeat protein